MNACRRLWKWIFYYQAEPNLRCTLSHTLRNFKHKGVVNRCTAAVCVAVSTAVVCVCLVCNGSTAECRCRSLLAASVWAGASVRCPHAGVQHSHSRSRQLHLADTTRRVFPVLQLAEYWRHVHSWDCIQRYLQIQILLVQCITFNCFSWWKKLTEKLKKTFKNWYCCLCLVILQGPEAFEGFIIQARDAASNDLLGSFNITDPANSKLLTCASNAAATVSVWWWQYVLHNVTSTTSY